MFRRKPIRRTNGLPLLSAAIISRSVAAKNNQKQADTEADVEMKEKEEEERDRKTKETVDDAIKKEREREMKVAGIYPGGSTAIYERVGDDKVGERNLEGGKGGRGRISIGPGRLTRQSMPMRPAALSEGKVCKRKRHQAMKEGVEMGVV